MRGRRPFVEVSEDDRGPAVPVDWLHPANYARLADAVLSKAIDDLYSVAHRAAARRWLLHEFRDTFWADYRPAMNTVRLAQAVHAAFHAPQRRTGKY